MDFRDDEAAADLKDQAGELPPPLDTKAPDVLK
jgi:hypothetical protein